MRAVPYAVRTGLVAALAVALGATGAAGAAPPTTTAELLASGAPAATVAGAPGLAALAAQGWGAAQGRFADGPANATAPASGTRAPIMWTVAGSGFGHGVGLSQYGAAAMATAGQDAREILRFYYQNTTLGPVVDGMTLVVNLQDQVSTTSIATSALAAGGGTFTLSNGSTRITGTVGQPVVYTRSGSAVVATCSRCSGGTTVSGAVVTMSFNDGKTVAIVGDRRHDTGVVTVTPSTTNAATIQVGLRVRLHDEYLDHVMESPWTWPAAALEAQAAVSRAYGLMMVRAGLRSSCGCHVYDDTRDQVFGGYPSKDQLPSWAAWKAAVRAGGTSTTGIVPKYSGDVIQPYFSSSNGGATQAKEDVFGGAPVPYLRSVPDPWSLKPSNPMASWSRPVAQGALAGAFGISDVVKLNFSDRTQAGAVARAKGYSSHGDATEISGESLRSTLGLPSTWVRHGVTRITGADPATIAATVAQQVALSASTVVLTSSNPAALADTVSAPPLAAAVGAPMLLTDAKALPMPTVQELNRRAGQLKRAYLLGGTSTIGTEVERQLTARGLSVVRIGGVDRYEVSKAVALTIGKLRPVTSVVIAGGKALPDALSVGGAAAKLGRPILLTPQDSLGAAAASALDSLHPASAQVLGGDNSVSGMVVHQVQVKGIKAVRLSGRDRYAASAAIAAYYAPLVPGTTLVLAAGEDATLFDAVLGSGLRRPTVLTRMTTLPSDVRAFLQSAHWLGTITVIGGSTRVADDVVRDAIQS